MRVWNLLLFCPLPSGASERRDDSALLRRLEKEKVTKGLREHMVEHFGNSGEFSLEDNGMSMIIYDGFVKSPTSALRCTLRHCSVL